MWLINGTNLNRDFINGPNQAQSGIDIPLSVGTYTFTTFNNSVSNSLAYYGLNLCFNGDTGPDISGYGPAKTSMTSMPTITAIPSTVQTRLDGTSTTDTVPGAGTLSFVDSQYTVTLTNFWLSTPTVYDMDRVSPFTTSPDGTLDNVGQVTLVVAANVPESNSAITASLCLTVVGGVSLICSRTCWLPGARSMRSTRTRIPTIS